MTRIDKMRRLLKSLERIRKFLNTIADDELIEVDFCVASSREEEKAEDFQLDYYHVSVFDKTLRHYLEEEQDNILQELSLLGVDVESLCEE